MGGSGCQGEMAGLTQPSSGAPESKRRKNRPQDTCQGFPRLGMGWVRVTRGQVTAASKKATGRGGSWGEANGSDVPSVRMAG